TMARRIFWSRTQRLTAALLVVWLIANLALPWFAPALNRWHMLGFPLGYWLMAVGMLGLYLGVVVVYVVAMDRLEARLVEDARTEASGSPAGPA
ncbi:MAG: DUF4212 domain-containing protein, partial [Burkholderiales bacterium]|nr:DUF4212 domain-containing protein [Burkholderiales bacterium]